MYENHKDINKKAIISIKEIFQADWPLIIIHELYLKNQRKTYANEHWTKQTACFHFFILILFHSVCVCVPTFYADV